MRFYGPAFAQEITIDEDGRVSLLGLYGSIVHEDLAAPYPQIALYVQLLFDEEERANPSSVVLRLFHPEGRIVAEQATPPLQARPGPQEGAAYLHLQLTLENVTFPAHGQYLAALYVNDKAIWMCPFYVLES